MAFASRPCVKLSDLEKTFRADRAELGYNKLAHEKFCGCFLQSVCRDGVAFAPGPVNGRKFWSKTYPTRRF